MSDLLDRAEAIQRNAKSEWAVRSVQGAMALDLLPDLIAEIKRQKAHSATVLSHCDHLKMSIETLKAEVRSLQYQEQDLMKNSNALRTRAQKAEAEVERLRGETATKDHFVEANEMIIDSGDHFQYDTKMAACYWDEYQRTGRFEDMTRWLKHRAYMKIVGRCIRGSE